jgi:hypothetical protein
MRERKKIMKDQKVFDQEPSIISCKAISLSYTTEYGLSAINLFIYFKSVELDVTKMS